MRTCCVVSTPTVSFRPSFASLNGPGGLSVSNSHLVYTGFEKPSAIQQKGIVPFGKGLDVIQQAQSGTGKTATFCAGILQNLDYQQLECQALVLAPTRELAQQIEKVMRALGDYQQVKCHACVGGTSVREDTRILQAGVHVVVGTPGRVYDMLRRRALRADAIKMFVLDEADEMLSRGFKDQIYDIFQLLPPKLQVSFYFICCHLLPAILTISSICWLQCFCAIKPTGPRVSIVSTRTVHGAYVALLSFASTIGMPGLQ